MATVRITNVSSNAFTLIVGRMPVHIPAHRRADNPAEINIREDLLPALLKSLKKRPVLRVLPADAPVPVDEPVEEPSAPESPERAEFMAACKATKSGAGVWDLILPDGTALTVEADHHLKAKEIAYEMLYGTSADEADKE